MRPKINAHMLMLKQIFSLYFNQTIFWTDQRKKDPRYEIAYHRRRNNLGTHKKMRKVKAPEKEQQKLSLCKEKLNFDIYISFWFHSNAERLAGKTVH